jgi:thioredoxin 1
MNEKMSPVTPVTSATFDERVLRSTLPAAVDFYADWCGPCKMLAPQLERLAEEYRGRLEVFKVNVDDEGDLAVRFGISGIPTLVLFRDGRPADTVVGLLPPGLLKEKIEGLLAAGSGTRG